MSHIHSLRVYYEDTDAGGVVYYPNYLKFSERGRTELLSTIGLSNNSIKEDYKLIFVVRHVEADYLSPAKLEDILEVHTEVETISGASMIMPQSIFCNGKLLFEIKVTLVCVSLETFKPVRIPDEIREAFGQYIKP